MQKYDAVTIGSGASAMTFAVTMAEGGAKVCAFEKMQNIGGTSVNFRGTFAAESDMQRERVISYSRDEAFKNIMEYSHWKANPYLVRTIVNESAETITWLQKQGVIFYNVTTNIPNAPQTYHLIRNSGEDVIKALAARAKESGITIKTSTPVKKIIKENGKIVGVIAEENGVEVMVETKAVMVASGGYANNAEWIKKYSGLDLDSNIIPIGNEGKMGDGIRMAWEAGAADDGMGLLEMLRTGRDKPGTMSQIGFAVVQPDLWIDAKGRRFCDEAVTFEDTSMGNANVKQKDGSTYSIFDTGIVQELMTKGIEKAMALDFPPGTKLTNLAKELEDAPKNRIEDVFQAGSVKELAPKINVDPVVLQETVDEYNTYCELQHDALFAKNPKYLRALRGPQFYAVKAQTVFLGTMGGTKINGKTEVLDKNDNIIPGLYAGGFDAAGMYGDSYSMKCSTGLASSFALNSGRVAAKNALKYLRKL
jgi:fumarate reductase flavoprotein subunit